MGMFDWFSPSPPPAAAKPPPPPTTAGASATQPTQECPRNAKHPCDVNKLMIKVTAPGPEGTPEKTFKLETTKVRRLEPVTDVKDRSTLTLLKTYDLLIECTANPPSSTKAKTDQAEIEGRAYYTTPDCETQSHALLTLKDLLTSKETILKKIGAEEIEMPAKKFNARDSYIDHADKQKQTLDNALNVFGIVKSLIESIFGYVQDVDLRADACGKRARGDGGNLNQMLIARVRVFRTTKWAIGVKIPALGSFKAEKAQSVDVHGISTTKSSTTSTSSFGANQSTTSSTQSGQGALGTYSYTGQTQRGEDVNSYQQSRDVKDGSVTQTFKEQHSGSDGRQMDNKDGEITSTDIKKRLESERGFDLIISIDDKEIEVGEGLKKIKELIENICEAITDVRKLFDKVPQVGWKFTFDVSVFAGTLTMECTPHYVDGVKANGRYYAIEHKLNGKIEFKIFSVSIELSFGVDATCLDSGLVLKIAGKLSLECSIAKELSLDMWTPKQELELAASAEAKLSVVGYVSLLGKTLADAELSVSTGLDFKGKFEAELSTRKFDLTGKLKTKKIELTGYIRGWLWDSKMDPKTLLPERELYSF